VSFLLGNLYAKRGDVYLREKDFRSAANDFARIFKGIPNLANTVDRWRWFGSTSDERYFLDIKTLEFSDYATNAKLWMKVQKKNGSSVTEYEFNCRDKELRPHSLVEYNAAGTVVNSITVSGDWSTPIPGSIGEDLYLGMCAESSR
jgi:hypothetical protein